MEEFARRISVQTEGTKNILIIELQDGETLIPYCCKILQSCNIPGLLPMRHQTLDGVTRLRYDIGGKMKLRDFMMQNRLTYQNGVLLLRNLSEAFLHLNEYFLSTEMCYLDPDQLYVADGLHVYMACLPVRQEFVQNGAKQLKSFYEQLLSEYFATSDCNSYDDMFKWVYKASLFDLEAFYDRFLKQAEPPKAPAQPVAKPSASAAAAAAVSEAAAAGVAAAGAVVSDLQEKLPDVMKGRVKGLQALYPEAMEELSNSKVKGSRTGGNPHAQSAESVQPQKESAALNIPGGRAFEIPGGSKQAPAKQRPERAEKSEKKSFWGLGGRGEKSEKNVPSAEERPRKFAGEKNKLPPMPAPEKRKPDKPAPASQPDEEWDSGTILVDGRQEAPVPAQDEAQPSRKAYFVHNGKNVPVSPTPFMLGKYSTGLQLHYAIHDNNKVSRNHATILLEGGQYKIRDNQSRNGTFLNGKALIPLQPTPLSDGDEIKLYDEILIFHLV